VIYTSRKTHSFRALCTRGDKYSEKTSAWKGAKPTKAAWITVVKAIDAKNK
jgi:hypothetical protein